MVGIGVMGVAFELLMMNLHTPHAPQVGAEPQGVGSGP